MSRTWKCFGFATLVLALLLAARGTAQEQEKPAPLSPRLEEDVQKLIKDVNALNERLKTLSTPLQDTIKIPAIEKSLTEVGSDLRKLIDEVKTLNSRLDNLQTSYQQLAEKVRNQDTRVARGYDPRTNGTAGTIRLVNRSGVNATVAVDGRGYVLGPYETRLLENRPLGTFSYEVLADTFGVIQAPVTRTLTADEVFVIQINPR